jgi:hypothetical protein
MHQIRAWMHRHASQLGVARSDARDHALARVAAKWPGNGGLRQKRPGYLLGGVAFFLLTRQGCLL